MILITQNYKEMQQIMSNYVGIVRSNLRLDRAMRRLEIIWQEPEELYNNGLYQKKEMRGGQKKCSFPHFAVNSAPSTKRRACRRRF